MNKKLKIAIIGSRGYPYVYSGYETLVKELSERLVKKGHNVRVYCHRSLFKKKPKNINGIELVYTPSIETKFLSQIFNSFLSTIHFCFSNYDVGFFVNSANGPFGILTKIFNKSTCINVDGEEWLRPKWKGVGALYYKISSKIATIFFDKIITDSVEMMKIYKTKFKTESIVIAYGSTMKLNNANYYLKKNNLKKNSYYLVVGRLIPDNNSQLIVEGFIKSKSSKSLVIVGDVSYSDNYAKKIKSFSSNKIIFTGYINCESELSQLYNNAYAYIHGHEFGGTNPTMINALIINSRILALSTKFNKEMLNKKEHVLFDKDIRSIQKAISFIESKKNKAKKYLLPEKYKWSYIINQYLDCFNNLSN